MTDILFIEPNDLVRDKLDPVFSSAGLNLVPAADIFQAQSLINETPPELIILDLIEEDTVGLDPLNEIRGIYPKIDIIVTSVFNSIETVVGAMKLGAVDYLSKPYSPIDLITKIQGRLRLKVKSADSKNPETKTANEKDLVGKSPAIVNIRNIVSGIANTKNPVLITGESGTGKTKIATLIHEVSDRSTKPLLSLNCSAFSDELFLECELFGFVKGAFKGASLSREGVFVKGNGGAVIIEEIGYMPLETQSKLLRFLQSDEMWRVGENVGISTNTRIIATSTDNLKDRITNNEFREDLYFRLSSTIIDAPPLHKRREDIPLLIKYFLKGLHRRGDHHHKLEKKALSELCSLSYPGNIRELRNILDQIISTASDEIIDIGTLESARIRKKPQSDSAFQKVLNTEKEIIEEVVKRNPRDMDSAAEELGMSRTTLWRRMKKYNLLVSKRK